ncbi:hypothetical protein QG516_10565 [Pedobacter gandavensis]|uniref:hypothetical protein n=1 Tax=Pedobacter gandavensis TaxID=2679963 RepID=UPI002478B1CF|nr:hypothetical protein [Pedobacter gandavensis]WGQ12080.1 hypothetical protein QG516_10565 [Pedobacter gandavensis]
MQAMQDKDFDQLFKDKFEGAEIRPSANLWGNIEKELTPKKKRVFPIYWAAAAAVAVIAVSVGLLAPETEKMQLHGTTAGSGNSAAVINKAGNNRTAAESTSTGAITVPFADEGDPTGTPLVLAPKLKLKNLVQENNLVAVQRNEKIKRHQIKAVEMKTTLKEEELKSMPELATENVIANVPIPDVQRGDQELIETEGRERKGIRNVGDVINFVVDKLDKREQKLIQFKTDEDDNSSLIAVNIGILKFNSKKNK